MTLKSTWELTRNVDFRGRVTVAVYLASIAILNEGANQNSDRYRMAVEAKSRVDLVGEAFIWPIASNATIAAAAENGPAEVSDSDIQYVVSSIWDEVSEKRYLPPAANMASPSVVVLPTDPPPTIEWEGAPVEDQT